MIPSRIRAKRIGNFNEFLIRHLWQGIVVDDRARSSLEVPDDIGGRRLRVIAAIEACRRAHAGP